jgi:hypothetical protein
VNSSVDLNRKEDVIELGPWIEYSHGTPASAILLFRSLNAKRRKRRKEKSFPFFFLSCQDEEDRGQTSATPSSQDFPFFFLERKKERKDIFEIFYLACAIQYFLQIIIPFRKKKKTNEELNNEIITNRVQT